MGTFTCGSFLVVVAGLGVCFAALKQPTELWTSAVFTLGLAVFCTSITCALFLRGRPRVFWAGFAIFGLAHVLLHADLGRNETAPRGSAFDPDLGNRSLLIKPLRALHATLHPEPANPRALVSYWNYEQDMPYKVPAGRAWERERGYFLQAANLIAGLLFAAAGGLIAVVAIGARGEPSVPRGRRGEPATPGDPTPGDPVATA